jgi:parvulin-like peptidyl-prolyl isomerase
LPPVPYFPRCDRIGGSLQSPPRIGFPAGGGSSDTHRMTHFRPSAITRVAATAGAVVLVLAGAATMAWSAEPQPTAPPALEPIMRPSQIVPEQPKAISRPDSWPGGKKTGGNPEAIGKHILSSIRENPGAPLEPLEAITPEAVAGSVIQAQYTESFVPPQLPPSATATSQDLARLNMQSLETAMVVARVGPEVVLASDLMTPAASEWLAKVSPGLEPEQIRELKLMIYKQVLPPHIETLLVFVDACRTIPEERLPEIETKVNEAFDESQLQKMMEEAGVSGIREYEQKLKAQGQSLDRVRKMFFERALAQQWLSTQVETDDEIPHADMIAWYENHLAEYDIPAKARFEQLTVKITPTQPRDQAWNKLAAMGNEVFGGRPFADVAREKSEGPTASGGGVYDWTTKGALVSKVVDEAIFTLPVGELSTILDDGSALHIIRVTERTEAGRTPFIEAQVGIRMKLLEDRKKTEMEAYLKRLKDRTPVWTIFDDDPADTVTAGRPTQMR